METSGYVYTHLKELQVQRVDEDVYMIDLNLEFNHFITDIDGKEYRIDKLPHTLRLAGSKETAENKNARVIPREEVYYRSVVIVYNARSGTITRYIIHQK